jgi:hypothetical protein
MDTCRTPDTGPADAGHVDADRATNGVSGIRTSSTATTTAGERGNGHSEFSYPYGGGQGV